MYFDLFVRAIIVSRIACPAGRRNSTFKNVVVVFFFFIIFLGNKIKKKKNKLHTYMKYVSLFIDVIIYRRFIYYSIPYSCVYYNMYVFIYIYIFLYKYLCFFFLYIYTRVLSISVPKGPRAMKTAACSRDLLTRAAEQKGREKKKADVS